MSGAWRRLHGAMVWTVLLPVKLYRATISRALGRIFPFPICRFQPTCSQYMIEAVEKKGVVVGVLKGLWRICRCNPFCKGGWDPVEGEEGVEGEEPKE